MGKKESLCYNKPTGGNADMDDKQRDLIPVAAIALFLVIIIALCAVRLHQRRLQKTRPHAVSER